ncbi:MULTISPECIES: preprotein translocase subunit SecG [unclassified Duganella]|uniref:preprotein translocase subunit SecG n=1 Tax=unclassified Duganella TaxID=2636909 RepID=UPI0008882940|nr:MULTISPECIES: preprotein translocase subunit SecG [unclassified Duganella]SDF48952.1 preprotein translocase subunit SecG [Duganella sp. OV458]SDI78031.1 protein translocase subunit secG [Duganella sp. OV510]
MNFFNLVIVVQVVSAIAIIGLVLLQHGKGADMGAAFGSGASGSLFGATGSSNFMSKSTGVAAAIFFIATLSLSYITTHRANNVSGGVMDRAQTTVPAAPAAAPATAPAAPAASAPVAPAPANSIPK